MKTTTNIINIKEFANSNIIEKPLTKGVIRIYDDNNTLIYETHNMIVYSGRKLIFDLFFNCLSKALDSNFSASESTNMTKFSLNFGYIGSAKLTKQESVYNDFFNNKTRKEKLSSSDIEINPDSDTDTDLFITFSKTITGDNNFQQFDEIGLSYVLDNNNTEILFSRAILDPVFLGVDGKYTLKYTIYF